MPSWSSWANQVSALYSVRLFCIRILCTVHCCRTAPYDKTMFPLYISAPFLSILSFPRLFSAYGIIPSRSDRDQKCHILRKVGRINPDNAACAIPCRDLCLRRCSLHTSQPARAAAFPIRHRHRARALLLHPAGTRRQIPPQRSVAHVDRLSQVPPPDAAVLRF